MIVTNVTPLSTTAPLPVGLVAAVGTGMTAARNDHVHVDTLPFDAIQASFRAGRRMLGEFSAYGVITPDVTDGGYIFPFGTGMGATLAGGLIITCTAISGELFSSFSGSAANNEGILGSVNGGSNALRTATAPNKSPRMLLRWYPGAAAAANLVTLAGFPAVVDGNNPSATSSGAYIRLQTTGNMFFVTRQGLTETTTDLGARPTSLKSYEIESADAGVTWTLRNDTTGVVVATHTTNVPTVTTGCAYSLYGIQTGAGTPTFFNVAYMRVEAGFTP